MNLKQFSLSILFCGVSLASYPSQASQVDFKSSYQAYQDALASGKPELILSTAQDAYNQAQSVYGKDSVDMANLALNWASALIDNQEKKASGNLKAAELLQFALGVYEQQYGEYGVELVDPLLGLASISKDMVKKKDYFNRVLEIARKSDDKLLLADMQIETVLGLAGTPEYNRKVQNYVFSALSTYSELLPEDALKRVKTTYLAASIRFSQKKFVKATELFEEVVKQFDKLNYDHPYELTSHAKLVELYERQGESDKSTKHCLAIGEMTPWSDDQDQTPLYRKEPKWPMSYVKAGKSGMAQVAFKVDKQGFVTEAEVITVEGGKKFGKAALEAVKKWRYAPKFENGQPVVAKSKVQIDFNML